LPAGTPSPRWGIRRRRVQRRRTDISDSDATGPHYSVFFVRAATAQPTLYFDSRPDSGYSVDNLPPRRRRHSPQVTASGPRRSIGAPAAPETSTSSGYTVVLASGFSLELAA
jgi:hypothetical protein